MPRDTCKRYDRKFCGTPLQETSNLVRVLSHARTPAEICAHILPHIRRFGVTHVLAGTMPSIGAGPRQQLGHVLLGQWPEEWVARYFGQGYLFRDPTIRMVRQQHDPFLWSEIESGFLRDPFARRVMNEATEFRLRNGFTIAMPTLEGESIGFSIAGEKLELSPQARGIVKLIAAHAVGKALLLKERDGERSDAAAWLTPRERETLLWVTEGFTEGEIGDKMAISIHGVDKHLRSVREKLGVRSTVQAVSEGFRRGLID